jgi:hypothetical protein
VGEFERLLSPGRVEKHIEDGVLYAAVDDVAMWLERRALHASDPDAAAALTDSASVLLRLLAVLSGTDKAPGEGAQS